LVAKGCTNKQIADRLFISIETVRKHLKNSYKKLEAHNKIEALRKVGLMH
jgi:DNA-binding CsgD family transcriptional regulator